MITSGALRFWLANVFRNRSLKMKSGPHGRRFSSQEVNWFVSIALIKLLVPRRNAERRRSHLRSANVYFRVRLAVVKY